MAIRPEDEYSGQTVAADADYPEGSAQNDTSPGSNDGTPFERAWLNDIWGFLQKILDVASITPSGNPDTVQASDYWDGLQQTFAGYGDTASRPSSPFNGQMYFDTDLNTPIWWDGNNWVDAVGATA